MGVSRPSITLWRKVVVASLLVASHAAMIPNSMLTPKEGFAIAITDTKIEFHIGADDRHRLEGLPWHLPLDEWQDQGVHLLIIRRGESRHLRGAARYTLCHQRDDPAYGRARGTQLSRNRATRYPFAQPCRKCSCRSTAYTSRSTRTRWYCTVYERRPRLYRDAPGSAGHSTRDPLSSSVYATH